MVETTTVSGKDDFVDALVQSENNPLEAEQQRVECYNIWREYADENGDCLLLVIPEWFSDKELDARRPFIFAEIEHDDPDSGAVLFSEMSILNISVVENQALGDLGMGVAVEELDISKESDFIDEPGKMWVPRSQMDAFEHE